MRHDNSSQLVNSSKTGDDSGDSGVGAIVKALVRISLRLDGSISGCVDRTAEASSSFVTLISQM